MNATLPSNPVLTPMLEIFLKKVDFSKSGWPSSFDVSPEMELRPRARLFGIPLDVHLSNDTSIIYPKGFVAELLKVQKQLAEKQQRILHIKAGDTFAMVVSDHGKVFSFGMNDKTQLASKTRQNEFQASSRYVKNLSLNKAKCLSLGGSHGVFLDQNNNMFTWGDNSYGQLGLGHNQANEAMHVINSTKDPVNIVQARGSRTIVVTETNQMVQWDSKIHSRQTKQSQNKSLLVDMAHLKDFNRVSPFKQASHLARVRKKIHTKHRQTRARLTTLKIRNKSSSPQPSLASLGFGPNDSVNLDKLGGDDSVTFEFYPSNNDLHQPENLFSGMMYRFSSKNSVKTVSLGHSFSLILSENGKLFAQGSNSSGQCGFSANEVDFLYSPECIDYFQQKGSFIKQAECGMHHSVVMTKSGKVLTFGANDNYQLGHATAKMQGRPSILRLPDMDNDGLAFRAKNVGATAHGSCVLTEDNRVFLMGAFGVGLQKTPRLFPFEITFFEEGIKNNFVPVKLCTSWSSTVSVCYLAMLDFRGLKTNVKNYRDQLSSNFASKWLRYPGDCLLCPYDQTLLEFISPKSFLRSEYSQTKSKLEFMDNVVFDDQAKQQRLRTSISKAKLRRTSRVKSRSRSTQRKAAKQSQFGSNKSARDQKQNRFGREQIRLGVQNNLMIKKIRMGSRFRIEEEVNGYIRPDQLKIEKKNHAEELLRLSGPSKQSQGLAGSVRGLNQEGQSSQKSEKPKANTSFYDSIEQQKNYFLDFLEGPARKHKKKEENNPRYGRIPVVSEPVVATEDLVLDKSELRAAETYEDPFMNSRKPKKKISKSPVRRPSPVFKNLEQRQREKSIEKLKQSFSKIAKKKEQSVRFLPAEHVSNDSFGEPAISIQEKKEISAKKRVSKKRKKSAVRKSKKSTKKAIAMDQILKNSEPTANEIRVSQDQLLSQMQHSSSRVKTSKVINQLRYEEAQTDKKAFKSSLKKGPGRFDRSADREAPRVMFSESLPKPSESSGRPLISVSIRWNLCSLVTDQK